VISKTSSIAKGASLVLQLIKIDLAVFPETKCQGLFNQFVGLHNEVSRIYTFREMPIKYEKAIIITS